MSNRYSGNRHNENFFRDALSEIPTYFKVLWLAGLTISLSVTGFLLYLLWTLVQGLVG